ncbi:hypothetical protein B0H11DRAFT_1898012 [Mycena galericulata]|nr:hypothetical protein B0H11DRAFT_1898012 [Mycena galericulata]
MPKGPMWDGGKSPKGRFALIGVRDTTEHLQRRRIWNRAFNTASVKAYEPILRARMEQLFDALKTNCGDPVPSQTNTAPVDLAEWLSFFAYAVRTGVHAHQR